MIERRSLRIGHLYPDVMNLYGDRGNVLALVQRARWRGIDATVIPIGLGERFIGEGIDLLFAGGDQDREQRRVADDLAGQKGGLVREAIEDGLPALVVCGSYQLFGRYYRPAEGENLPGIGVFDVTTRHPGADVARCVGNIVVDWDGYRVVGFENHGGRTFLGEGARPFGKVVYGFGNNGHDGTEGARHKNAVGTYLHGSLLPKNPRLADHILQLALERKYGDGQLATLDDEIEERARTVAIARARRDRKQPNVGASETRL